MSSGDVRNSLPVGGKGLPVGGKGKGFPMGATTRFVHLTKETTFIVDPPFVPPFSLFPSCHTFLLLYQTWQKFASQD
jgi:hypothetical protein